VTDDVAQEVPGTTPALDKLVSVFIRMRDAKSRMEAEHKQALAEIEDQMKMVKSALLDHCKETGVESVRTNAGTFYRTTKSRYWTNDWEAMGSFIVEHNALGLLENRLHQGNLKKFLDENKDLVPPGLNVDTEYSITVTKSKGGKDD